MTEKDVPPMLLNCPFCGGEAFMDGEGHYRWDESYVHCRGCGLTFALDFSSEGAAAAAWNRRAALATRSDPSVSSAVIHERAEIIAIALVQEGVLSSDNRERGARVIERMLGEIATRSEEPLMDERGADLLERYGSHLSARAGYRGADCWGDPCICGYNAALRSLRAAEPSVPQNEPEPDECGHDMALHYRDGNGDLRCRREERGVSTKGVLGLPTLRVCDCINGRKFKGKYTMSGRRVTRDQLPERLRKMLDERDAADAPAEPQAYALPPDPNRPVEKINPKSSGSDGAPKK